VADVPGSVATTASIVVGGAINGNVEARADHDWYAITLTAGQSIAISVVGLGATPLIDPFVTLRDAAGNAIQSDDDGGTGRDSLIHFTASTSGTYYIDVGAYADLYTGGFQLTVSPFTQPAPNVWTYDQVGEQLVSGYWGGDVHHFDVQQGGTITVNITALTAAGQNLARHALDLWSDIIGVTFREVTSGAQITFDDNQSGSFEDDVHSGGITSSAFINVSTQWLAQYGTSIHSHTFEAYIHEIGHALGLGHAGDYNGSATYPADALYLNDCRCVSIMSYFDQAANTYFANQGFSKNFVSSPMDADILAVAALYGLSTTTRTGDTTYGFHSNAGRDTFDATQAGGPFSYTIFDSGGTDTLDYSGYSANQLIDLNWETFSNVGGKVGNVSIARGTVIENAIGGSGSDTLIGNAADNVLDGRDGDDNLQGGAGNDRLIGRSGADTMSGGTGNDVYYVDNPGDAVIENSGEGTDTVASTISYRLGANVDKLVLQGSADINGSGNSLNNGIAGNSGNNSLEGGAGNDSLTGGAGADTLTGGAGRDTFVFKTISDSPVGASDTITDFATGDRIDLRAIDANSLLAGDQAFAFIGANLFHNVAGELRYEQISGSTYIEGDISGDGVADFMIKVDGLHAFAGTDFLA